MSGEFVTYFGFGSLVNRATRPAGEDAQPARLYGWQRVWGHRVLSAQQPSDEPPRSCCSLTVRKLSAADNSTGVETGFIEGVVVTIPVSELPALDRREAGYDRQVLAATDFDLPLGFEAKEIHMYVSRPDHRGDATAEFPILQSYVDCVLAGYCDVFSDQGMQRFVDSTHGWHGVIENERHEPKYPRAVSLPTAQLATIDRVVKQARTSS